MNPIFDRISRLRRRRHHIIDLEATFTSMPQTNSCECRLVLNLPAENNVYAKDEPIYLHPMFYEYADGATLFDEPLTELWGTAISSNYSGYGQSRSGHKRLRTRGIPSEAGGWADLEKLVCAELEEARRTLHQIVSRWAENNPQAYNPPPLLPNEVYCVPLRIAPTGSLLF